MDKYDRLRKLERNQWLEQYAQDHPNATLEEIGVVFNISKQRVWELLKLAQKRNNNEAITL